MKPTAPKCKKNKEKSPVLTSPFFFAFCFTRWRLHVVPLPIHAHIHPHSTHRPWKEEINARKGSAGVWITERSEETHWQKGWGWLALDGKWWGRGKWKMWRSGISVFVLHCIPQIPLLWSFVRDFPRCVRVEEKTSKTGSRQSGEWWGDF